MKVPPWMIAGFMIAALNPWVTGADMQAFGEGAGDGDSPLVGGGSLSEDIPHYLKAPLNYSEEELSEHYQRAVTEEVALQGGAGSDEGSTWWASGDLVYLAPIPDLVWEMRAESELALADGGEDPVEAADSGERIQRLEEENALLKERLERLENSIRPGEVGKSAPGPRLRVPSAPPLLRRGFVPRKPFPGARSILSPPRFRPFTHEGMSMRRSGIPGRNEGRSLREQLRFMRNADKALGNDVQSRHYQDVRLEVIKAMLDGEINSRYAVQYLADLVDVFRTYERLARFRLADGVRPPLSVEEVRQNPEGLFVWVSEVNEQKRRLVREDLLAGAQ